MKKMMSTLKKLPFRIIIPIVLAVAVIVPTWSFLHSIHYKVADYFFSWGPANIRDFGEHKKEFELLIEEIDGFVAEQPNFFEEFTGDCYVRENGLLFQRVELSYPDDEYFHKFTIEGWETIGNFRKVFPNDFYYSSIMINRNYPNYIIFRCDERSQRILVYTRDGRPDQLIDQYWEKYDFVRVKRVARGWYDIAPR